MNNKILTLLEKIFRKPYDMDSLEGINSIPVPAKDYHTENDLQNPIYYVLQRKATEHKKNGRMDLAIACLRKSNALSDYATRPLLTETEYFRLVKYLEKDGQTEEAHRVSEEIQMRHPEFGDKRISNLSRIKKTIEQCKNYENDLVYISTNSYCPICKKFNKQIFSISGKDSFYPKLPTKISKDGGCPDCIMGISIYFPEISHNITYNDISQGD